MRVDELVSAIQTALTDAGCESVYFGDTPEWHNNRSKKYPSGLVMPPEVETQGDLSQLRHTYRLKVQVLELSGYKSGKKAHVASLRSMQDVVLVAIRDVLTNQSDVIGVSCRHIPIVMEYNDVLTGWHLDLAVITQDCV